MGNRGITRLDKTFGQTATTSKEVNEPYPLFITPGSCSNMRRAYDILPLATWQGVMSNIAFPPLAHPSLVCEQKGAPLCSWLEGRAEPCASKGLRQPAKLHGKATPQVKRVSSCKPRVSVSEVVILRRLGLQTSGRSCRPSRRRFSSLGYVLSDIPIGCRVLYHISATIGGGRAKSVKCKM